MAETVPEITQTPAIVQPHLAPPEVAAAIRTTSSTSIFSRWGRPIQPVLPLPPPALHNSSEAEFESALQQRDLYNKCTEHPEPVLVRVGVSKCWSIDKKLLSQHSDKFAAAFRDHNPEARSGRFDIKDSNVPAFELFVSWLFTFPKPYISSYTGPDIYLPTGVGSLTVENCTDAWFLADGLIAPEFSRYVLGLFIRTVSADLGTSYRANRTLASTISRIIDSETLEPGLQRFAKQWASWAVQSDFKIVKSFQLTGIRSFLTDEKGPAPAIIHDPRSFAYDHWFQQCSVEGKVQPTCSHVVPGVEAQLPRLQTTIRKPPRDYLKELYDWADKNLPRPEAKEVALGIVISLTFGFSLAMIALAALDMAHPLDGVRDTTDKYALFVGCLTLVLCWVPLPILPGFFAFGAGIASAVDTVTCKSIAVSDYGYPPLPTCGRIEAMAIINFIFCGLSPILMWIWIECLES